MVAPTKSGPGRRGWVVLVTAAVGGVIAGVGLAQRGGRGLVPSFVAPATAGGPVSREPQPASHRAAPAAAEPARRPSAPAAALAGLPAYPGATPRGLGENIVAAGMPMAVAYFTTPDPASDVMAFYVNALKGSHAHLMHEWSTPTTGYVGWRNEKTDELHGVVIRRDGEETMVFPSTMAPGRARLASQSQQVPSVLPLPDGAEGTMVVSMGGGANGLRQSSVVTSVPLATVASLTDFYRTAFAKKGWHVEQVLVNSGHFGRVTATRDDMRAEAFLRRVAGGDEGPHVEIYVLLTTRDHA